MQELINEYLPIIISSSSIYLFVIVSIRLFGKKEFAQLSLVDVVFVLLISNAVQNAMVGPNTTLMGGIVAASTLFVMNFLFKYLLYKFPRIDQWILGNPVVLIYNGEIQESNLRKEKISVNELLESVREHGINSIKEVDLAMLETDGNISVLSDNYQKRSIQKRKRKKHLNL